jgi:hypothetical protein
VNAEAINFEEDDFDRSWRPDKGDPNPLVGLFQKLIRATDSNGNRVPVAVLKDKAGTRWGVWIYWDILREEFQRERPRIGEETTVWKSTEKEKSKTGRGYWKFAARTPRSDQATLSWDELAPTSEPELPADPPATKPEDDGDDVPW